MTNERTGLELAGAAGERFRLETRLGAGSFGEVYRAVGTMSGTVVAVKMVPKSKLADPATLAVRTMLNETRPKMLEVDHPNVVRVLHVDAGTDSAVGPYVMMEFVEGGNLQQMLDGRRKTYETLSLDDALDLMRQIALGAQAVNEHLVHRDIKPDNILLDASMSPPRPRIADFGVAKVAAEATRPTAETLKGVQPVWYMAPEAWRDETHTWRMDVYSVGLVFYEILTLEHPLLKHVSQPWDHVRWSKVHQAIPCEDVRNVRSGVPLALAKLLLRMVDKSPGNRPSWGEVIAGLDPRPAGPAADAGLDPELVAVFKRRADEQFRQDQRRVAEDLKRREHSDKNEIVLEEVRQSGKRLLARFDALVEALNQTERASRVEIVAPDDLTRRYRLPNGLDLRCEIFPAPESLRTRRGQVLGGGFMGVPGALSANLVLTGSSEDVPTAIWTAVEADVMALISGHKRLDRLRDAGLDEPTLRFMLGEGRDATWRRHAPMFFGFSDARQFFEEFERGTGAMHVYTFSNGQDPLKTFQQILADAIQIPARR